MEQLFSDADRVCIAKVLTAEVRSALGVDRQRMELVELLVATAREIGVADAIEKGKQAALGAIDKALAAFHAAAAAGGAGTMLAGRTLTAGPASAPCALKRESEVADGAVREVR